MIKDEIFRANDIRGIYNENLTDETAYIIGKSFGTYALLKNINKVKSQPANAGWLFFKDKMDEKILAITIYHFRMDHTLLVQLV